MSFISAGGAVVGAGEVGANERSLRFNSADSAYLNRTPASAGNRKTWTWSAWVKRSGLGTLQELFNGNWASNDNGFLTINFSSADKFEVQIYNSVLRITTQVFRDVSAWYHFVVAVDTTQATAANRVKVYLNGLEITSFSTNNAPTLNLDTAINYNGAHYIGTFSGSGNLFNGYMTEVNLIDGSALTPTSFGEFNIDTGVWQPTAYEGEYGTNGFYLNFSNNSTIDALGTDFSGNGNTWSDNGFSVTAGAGNDSLVDTPTRFGTDTGLGGEVRGNYATLNPLDKGSSQTTANGNLDISGALIFGHTKSTLFVSSGKWYFEYTLGTFQGDTAMGLANSSAALTTFSGENTNSVGYLADGRFFYNSASTSYSSYTTGDVIGIAFDCDTGKIWIAKNNTWQNSGNPAAGTGQVQTVTWSNFTPIARTVGSGALSVNFGQRAFAYTAPEGFKALVTTNLPEPTIDDGGEYFNTVLYTGNGSTQSITGVGFQPDWTWVKGRSVAQGHSLYDVLRGYDFKVLSSDSTSAQVTETGGVSAVASDGFSLNGNNTIIGGSNGSGATYVAWCWRAGGAGVSNTAGTISSTVSASTDAGFSIVTYTGTGSSATVGHGLGAAPNMIIIKPRNSVTNWVVGHASAGFDAVLQLNTTEDTEAGTGAFGGVSPTGSVFTVAANGGSYNTNQSTTTYVAYCFAAIPGYSAFGSYTGNGSADGPFVFLGFRPAWVMIKKTGIDNWMIHDTTRDPFNLANKRLMASGSDAESTADNQRDILSNGFKLRSTNTATNESGSTYIYMAFAESPFKFSLAR